MTAPQKVGTKQSEPHALVDRRLKHVYELNLFSRIFFVSGRDKEITG
jgi:hypothetical protein